MSKNAAIFLEKYSSHLRHIKAYNLAQPYQDSFFRLYRLSFQNSQPFQKETVETLVRMSTSRSLNWCWTCYLLWISRPCTRSVKLYLSIRVFAQNSLDSQAPMTSKDELQNLLTKVHLLTLWFISTLFPVQLYFVCLMLRPSQYVKVIVNLLFWSTGVALKAVKNAWML